MVPRAVPMGTGLYSSADLARRSRVKRSRELETELAAEGDAMAAWLFAGAAPAAAASKRRATSGTGGLIDFGGKQRAWVPVVLDEADGHGLRGVKWRETRAETARRGRGVKKRTREAVSSAPPRKKARRICMHDDE